MPRMIELIRTSQVPANLMQAAARGSLSVAPAEMIEILIHLALHNKVFGQQARLALAGWDEKACLAAAQNPDTSPEVLGYWMAPENLRVPLLSALAENPSVTIESLEKLATHRARPVLDVLLSSARAMNSSELLKVLRSNPNLRPAEIAEIERKLGASSMTVPGTAESEGAVHDEAVEAALSDYLKENAKELEALPEKPFQAASPAGASSESTSEIAEKSAVPVAVKSAAVAAPPKQASAASHAKIELAGGEKRDSTVQKIAKLDIKGRINLAMRGSKEDRSILIRDMTKVVCLAVLDSPKLGEAEVEGFAKQKNVLDSVLRTIPMKRRFAKSYAIQRNLVFNPRMPSDAALGLLKNLLPTDLKSLSESKEVSEPIRRAAFRLFRQKMERHKS